MKSLQRAKQCRDEFINAWIGNVPEEITKLFSIIIEQADRENIFNINTVTDYGSGLLHLLIESDNQDQTKAADCLLVYGADINLAEGKFKTTPLLIAINKFSTLNSRYNYVTYLLAKGVDVNKANADGQTPLHFVVKLIDYAMYNHSRDLLNPLLKKGALVTKQNNEGENAYELLEEKIDKNSAASAIEELKDCLALLKKHCKQEKRAAKEQATKLFRDIDEKWKSNGKPYLFLKSKILECVEEDGLFDINSKAGLGAALLHYAALRHEIEVIQLLLINGANANIQTETSVKDLGLKGYTPLHCVYEGLNSRSINIDENARLCILLLLKHGASINISDCRGNSILKIAKDNLQSGNQVLYDLLIEGQNNPYEKNKLAALKTGTYQVASLLEICLFNTKNLISKTEIESMKDQLSEKIYLRLVN